MKPYRVTLMAATAMLLAGCADETPTDIGGDPSFGVAPSVAADMRNFVAIGTSVSMGWLDDGVLYSSQEQSWVKQLADDVGVEFTLPGIAAPGCQPPVAAPLIGFTRIDGSSAAKTRGSCAPHVAGMEAGAHNLAVENATAGEALNGTPETASGGRGPVTSRVLPAGMTQVSTMRSLEPTFVSVEFGGNEILPAQVGLLYPGVTYTPFEVFAANYSAIIEQVKATGAKAVLVSLPADLRKFPTLRTGPELAAQRAEFAAYHVRLNEDCDASANLIFVRGKVLTAIGMGAQRRALDFPPADLSCADVPGTPDYVLTPSDLAMLDGLVARMNEFIHGMAAENGYAVFSMGVLYDNSKDDVPFELESYLWSDRPYGPRISLDGVHPSVRGHEILARAARVTIQKTYGTAASRN